MLYYNALSSSRADGCEGDSLISPISRDTLSTNETHKNDNFDDWYIITQGAEERGLFSVNLNKQSSYLVI